MHERSTRRRAKCLGRRAWVAALTLSVVLGCAAPARAEPGGTEALLLAESRILFDLIIVRPLGIGEVVFGFLCFLPAALFAGQAIADPWDSFVVEPFEDTFTRSLGEFEEEF